jgi:signal transduction histidine kinase
MYVPLTRNRKFNGAFEIYYDITDKKQKLEDLLSQSSAILEDLGLTAALQWLIQDFAKHSDIRVSLKLPDVDNLFSQDAQIIIYRVFQEAFTNIGKHAHANRVTASIKREENNIAFLIEDDGKGFDIEQVESRYPTEKSLGLMAMDERARMLGGTIQVDSQPYEGTRITLRVLTENRKIGYESLSNHICR